MHQWITASQSVSILRQMPVAEEHITYEQNKHKIAVRDNLNEILFDMRLPITLSLTDQLEFQKNTPVHYIILLIQSGSCATGYFENGRNIDHKVFKTYMVRKKQGKSQIKHLKTKGKSRAGSRVRLANTVRFFEDINTRLNQYFDTHKIDRIAFSCPVTLIPYLFSSKVEPPFGKKDERILKIPKHVHTPNYEVLMRIHQFLLKGELTLHHPDHPLLHYIRNILN